MQAVNCRWKGAYEASAILQVLSLVAANAKPLRVQLPNNHRLAQNLSHIYYYQKPKYLFIGYLDPLGATRTCVWTCAGSGLEPLAPPLGPKKLISKI